MERALLLRIRVLLGGFALGVALAGITAFPLVWEVTLLSRWIGSGTTGLAGWIGTVRQGLVAADARYPFLFYGTDWLAFGHLVVASAFWGPIKDTVRNRFIVRWGMFACVATFPIIFVCGPLRGIPTFWWAIDCSFGTIGLAPLIVVDRAIGQLERLTPDRIGG